QDAGRPQLLPGKRTGRAAPPGYAHHRLGHVHAQAGLPAPAPRHRLLDCPVGRRPRAGRASFGRLPRPPGGSRQGADAAGGPGDRGLGFRAVEGQTWPVAFSPDGRLLASNNFSAKLTEQTQRTLRLWETATAAEVLKLPAADGNRPAFSADGRLLAVAAPSQEILVWDLVLGREHRRFKGVDASGTWLAFSPDGRRLLSGLSDPTLLVWDVGPRGAAPRTRLGAEGLAKAWPDLASADAPRAF